MALNYRAPASGTVSTIDIGSQGMGTNASTQMNTFYWLKKAIIQSRKDQYFMPLASVTNMPKHFGKTIKCYEYVPLLDVRNINDQGIDAAGASYSANRWEVRFQASQTALTGIPVSGDADLILADLAGTADAVTKSGAGPYTLTFNNGARTSMSVSTQALTLKVLTATNIPGSIVLQQSGNLYGSSKDVGTITGKIPALTENGGRFNRVGFTRLDREGSISKFGFFFDFTQESLDFDSDSELLERLSTELMNGAVQLTEAVLQKDLLGAAGVVVYGGSATSPATVTGEGAETAQSQLTYSLLVRMDQILTDNRCPRSTKVITGSRLVDTATIPACRVAFIGNELTPQLMKMKDFHNNKAFIEVQHYADAGTVLNGEIGSIGNFRFIVVPEMLSWAGVGATVTSNPNGHRSTNGKYDVFPVLVVGDDSFTTIGFQTDGKTVKFNVTTKMPGAESATLQDPYGETGFSSIKWYYGILIKRPERIACAKVLAPL